MADAATSFAQQLKRVLSLYRMYGPEHAMSQAAEAHAFSTVRSALEDPLLLELDARGLRSGDQWVLQDEGEDSWTRPLFADGVERIEIQPDVEAEEFVRLVRFWFHGLLGNMNSEHSFATLVWEQDFQGIAVTFRPVLMDPEREGADSDAARRAGALRRTLSSITEPKPKVRRVDPDYLTILQAVPGLSRLTPEQMEEAGREGPTQGTSLTEFDLSRLQQGMRLQGRGAGQRVLLFLSQHLDPNRAEWLELEDFIKRIVRTLMDADRLSELRSALDRMLQQSTDPQQHRRLLDAVFTPSGVEELVQRLDGADGDHAASLLRLAPMDQLPRLTSQMAAARGRTRARLHQVLVDRNPSPEHVAGFVAGSDAEGTRVWLALSEALGEAHRDAVLRMALVSEDPTVRVVAIEAIRSTELNVYRSLVAGNLKQAEGPEHAAILRLLVRAKDPLAAELAAKRLAEEDKNEDGRLEWVRCLASVGGPRALQTLISLLHDGGSKEERKAAALALSHFDESEAARALKAVGSLIFQDRGVRHACRTALKRRKSRMESGRV